MLRTPPRRRKRSSPMQNPIKRSKVLSETHEEIDNLEENESSLNNASRVKENGVEKHCLNDNTIQQAPEQSSQTKETSVNTNNADDSEIQLSADLCFCRNVYSKPGTSQNRPHVRNTTILNHAYSVSSISYPPRELFIYSNFGEGNMYHLLVT